MRRWGKAAHAQTLSRRVLSFLAMIARLLPACLAAAVFCASICAQSARDWVSLGHATEISAGAEIEARTTGNKRYRGQFKAADGDALVMTTASGEQRLARGTVSRVSVKTQGHRGRNTLIGLGIGAAAGLTLGAVADARCTGKCIEGNRPLGKEVGTALGALIGTIIGVAIPTGGWREVYRAP
jgi:hypothetical protein